MNKERLINGYEEWLSRYRWIWFGTLTFRRLDIKLWTANECFWRWIVEVENSERTDVFHWFRVTEHGAFKDNLHFHVLVGGLKNPSKWPWLLRWQDLAGDAEIYYFNRSLGGLRYMLKTAKPDTDFDILYDL
jgi:hypothetical protein